MMLLSETLVVHSPIKSVCLCSQEYGINWESVRRI